MLWGLWAGDVSKGDDIALIALGIEAGVQEDAGEPGAEAAASLKRGDGAPGFDSRLLERIGSALLFAQHRHGCSPEAVNMALEEIGEGIRVSGAGTLQKGLHGV